MVEELTKLLVGLAETIFIARLVSPRLPVAPSRSEAEGGVTGNAQFEPLAGD
ncbi:MAG: hypothetical protein HZA50_08870 [Planctomycetes bacterium]|nr:hypothetical protein [Planctomycetota bacterium]